MKQEICITGDLQIMADYARIRTPFTSFSFNPDVPSNALGTNEYSNGLNIEADVRGIKKVGGEEEILSTIPGNVVFIEGGFRSEASWVYIAATREGKWYMLTSGGITNITPGVGANPAVALSGYSDNVNITTSWVGSVFFINDGLRNPMYFLPTATEIALTLDADWNYTPGVVATRAGFVRNFCSPNVGNILVAGNLTQDLSGGTTVNFPTTIRWSQAFSNTGIPQTWIPTLTNVANEQEVPVRGPLVDGFFLGANFYLCSYWDTVVMSPIAYQNSTAPVFGVRLFNQGRGLINNNCWSNTDSAVYGVDSRDIWVFNGSDFAPLGNQKVRDYFFTNLSATYSDRIFMVNNTQKNQIEIYYPDLTSTGWCNKMLSWRYDLQIWNAPKDIANACMGTEGPVFMSGAFKYASRTVVYAQGSTASSKVIQTNRTNAFRGAAIPCLFERTNLVLQTDKGPVPYSSKVYIHRVLPEISGSGAVNITVGGANSTQQLPTYGQVGIVSIDTDNPWVTTQQNAVRTVSVKVQSNDATNAWNITALNWQATIVEDAF
jgi:hypothetical protein